MEKDAKSMKWKLAYAKNVDRKVPGTFALHVGIFMPFLSKINERMHENCTIASAKKIRSVLW